MDGWKRDSGKEITYQLITKVRVFLHKTTVKGMSEKHEPGGRDGSEFFSIPSAWPYLHRSSNKEWTREGFEYLRSNTAILS